METPFRGGGVGALPLQGRRLGGWVRGGPYSHTLLLLPGLPSLPPSLRGPKGRTGGSRVPRGRGGDGGRRGPNLRKVTARAKGRAGRRWGTRTRGRPSSGPGGRGASGAPGLTAVADDEQLEEVVVVPGHGGRVGVGAGVGVGVGIGLASSRSVAPPRTAAPAVADPLASLPFPSLPFAGFQSLASPRSLRVA